MKHFLFIITVLFPLSTIAQEVTKTEINEINSESSQGFSEVFSQNNPIKVHALSIPEKEDVTDHKMLIPSIFYCDRWCTNRILTIRRYRGSSQKITYLNGFLVPYFYYRNFKPIPNFTGLAACYENYPNNTDHKSSIDGFRFTSFTMTSN